MDPLNAVYLTFAAIIGGIRAYYQHRFGHQAFLKRDESLLDRGLLVVAVLAMVPILLSHIATDWFRFLDLPIPASAAWSGVPFLVGGGWLFWRSHHDLGVNWSARLAIHPSHTLVDTGVYRRVRHPMYAALLISGIGQFLVL